MMMALLPLSMHRHPCHRQAGFVALVTMALLPLIHDGVVALVAMVLLPSSIWHCRPRRNGVIIINHDIALVACCQAGIVAVDVEASSPLSQWQLLLLS
jgi:hypothetical protein